MTESNPESPTVVLQTLLQRLEQRAEDGFARVTYYGRALSRSENALHLATPTGVVAIPLNDIECVMPISPRHPESVWVGVRNGDRVRQLISVARVWTQLSHHVTVAASKAPARKFLASLS